ncbi:MAG: hydroxyacylglutathione hydrolase [Polyangiaceae bacterium]|jgi:hydroxyacylglutathione hydrolase
MRVVVIPCLKDNYAYLLIADSGDAVIVDPSETAPVRRAIQREAVVPRAIWCTHHHWDHVGGNESLAIEYRLPVIAHVSERERVPGWTRGVEDGGIERVAEATARCLLVPGHTRGAIAYFVTSGSDHVVFTGDTMFSAGCGRLFEGTPGQMHESLTSIARLPPRTRVYSGHEYTEANLRFAASVEPGNPDIARSRERAGGLRARLEPTVGTTLDEENRTNPFLRARSPAIRATLGFSPDVDDVRVFAALRAQKDAF